MGNPLSYHIILVPHAEEYECRLIKEQLEGPWIGIVMTIQDVLTVFTPRRLALLHELSMNPLKSIATLAKERKWALKTVQEDIIYLKSIGVIPMDWNVF